MKKYNFASSLSAKNGAVFFCRMAIKVLILVILFNGMFACTSPGSSKNNHRETKYRTRKDTPDPLLTTRELAADHPIMDTLLENGEATSSETLGFYTLQDDSLVIPPFEIAIALSAKAKERISNSGETIIVRIFLEGVPGDSSKIQLGDDGSFFVGDAEKEITYGQIARFEKVKFPKKIYDQLAVKDVDLTVNVYTGRKTSPNNLIMGDFLADKVSKIIRRRFTLQCKLIYGDD